MATCTGYSTRMDCFQIRAMIHRSSEKLFILVAISQLMTTSIKNTVAKITHLKGLLRTAFHVSYVRSHPHETG